MKTSGMKQTSQGQFYMPAVLDSGEVIDVDLPPKVVHLIPTVSMPSGHDWNWNAANSTFTAEDCLRATCGICGNRDDTQETEE